MSEVWKHVPGMCGVFASSKGRIMRPGAKKSEVKTGTYGCKTWNGYFVVKLKNPRKDVKVHRLVCKAFHGDPGGDEIVLHVDHNPGNNVPENLMWGDQSLNMAHHAEKPCVKLYLSARMLGNKHREKKT